MVNLGDYNQYKEARLVGDSNMIDAIETDDPYMFGIYERIFDFEELQVHLDELNRQRKDEEKYQRWVATHGHNIKRNKMTDECFRASFRLSGTLPFYERYIKELRG